MENELIKIKFHLIEKLGVYFEREEHLAPVAARIFAHIILTGKIGVTFDSLVDDLQASKSTVSTNLSHLQNLEKISYFTKTGDRKKYFIVNSDTFIKGINDMIHSWEEKKAMHKEVLDYKERMNNRVNVKQEELFNLEVHNKQIAFLNKVIVSTKGLKVEMSEYKRKNK